MVNWLREYPAVAEDPSSVHSTYSRELTVTHNFSSRESDTHFWPLLVTALMCRHTAMHAHTHNNNNKNLEKSENCIFFFQYQ